MLNSTQGFIDRIEQWARALRQDDFAAAQKWAEQLANDGEKLAQQPDFKQRFTARTGGFDSHEALVLLTQFLICTTEGRAVAVMRDPSDQGAGPTVPDP